jgi:hypothetical protein
LCRWCDGVGSCGIGRLPFTHDGDGITIHRYPGSGVFEVVFFIFHDIGWFFQEIEMHKDIGLRRLKKLNQEKTPGIL